MRDGLPLPKKLANAPELEPGLQFYLGAFYDLDSCRQAGFDIGPIPITAIMLYGQLVGCEGEDYDDLINHVRALDGVYMEHMRKKQKSK